MANKKTRSNRSFNSYKSRTKKSNRFVKFWNRSIYARAGMLLFVLVFAALGIHVYQQSRADAVTVEQKSGIGRCMNVYSDNIKDSTPINTTTCDGRDSEHIYYNWNQQMLHINSDYCIQPLFSGTALQTPVVLSPCANHAGEIWKFVADPQISSGNWGQYQNVNASQADGRAVCLTVPNGEGGVQLQIRACQGSYNDQDWRGKYYDPPTDNDPSGPGCGNWDNADAVGAKCVAQYVMGKNYGWGWSQYQCLVNLWNQESSWNRFALNPSSGATGIPQALPYSKMPQAAWLPSQGGQASAISQIDWGLSYINNRYGNPCNAWAHEQAYGWYGPEQPGGS